DWLRAATSCSATWPAITSVACTPSWWCRSDVAGDGNPTVCGARPAHGRRDTRDVRLVLGDERRDVDRRNPAFPTSSGGRTGGRQTADARGALRAGGAPHARRHPVRS